MMKRLILSLLWIIISVNVIVNAQNVVDNPIIREDLDYMFEKLDKSKIPTGYLLDYAVDLVELDEYNGRNLSEDNYIVYSIYEDLLYSIESASVNRLTSKDIAKDLAELSVSGNLCEINMSFLAYKYNYIKAGAIENNLINFSGNQIYDAYVNGKWQNPYNEEYLIGFIPSSEICQIGTVTYNFSKKYIYGNITPTNIMFDAGDGNGYRKISQDASLTVNYSSSGKKVLKLKIEVNNEVIESHSLIYVDDIEYSLMQKNPIPKLSEGVYIVNPYNTEKIIGAQVSTYYRDGNSKLTKPLIVVEGFDPWQLQIIIDGNLTDSPTLGYTNMLNFDGYSILKSEYDIIYIDWYDSIEDIKANAALLIEIIKKINQQKEAAGCTERSVMIGQSMGGVIARVALCMMEKSGMQHGVSTYVSHDSPHLGANVPLGCLYFIHQFVSFISGNPELTHLANIIAAVKIKNVEAHLLDIIHSPATQQMLVNYVGLDGYRLNLKHIEWQDELDKLGFPSGDEGYPIENLAIVNGGLYDQTGLINNLDGHYFYLDGNFKFKSWSEIVVKLFPNILKLVGADFLIDPIERVGGTKFLIHAEINPLIKYGSLLSELSVRYKKKFLFIPLKTYDIFQSAIYAPSSGFLYDSFGGSKYKMENDYSELKQYKGKDGVAKYDFTVGLTDEIMFIPTASALCIFEETEANYLRDYYQNPPIPEVECPFDAYILSESSEEHISADYEVYRWLLEQTNMEIIGPEYVTGITTYYVSGYAGSVKWSSSNTSIASIDDSGKLTIIGSGHVTITAESFVNGKLYRKTKDIMVNFPDIFIKHRYATDKGVSFYVKSTSNQSTELLEKLVAEGEIKYEWTIIDGNGEDFTYTSESGVFTYMPKKDEVLTVIVRLIGRDGNRGKVSSYVFNIKTPMETNYKYAIVDKYNKVYWIRSDNKYELGMPSEDFTAYFRTIPLNPEDNLTSLFSKYMKGNQCYISFPGRNGRMEYMAGKYLLMSKCWTFDLFNHEMFVEQLAQIMKISIDSERVIKEVKFNLCNTEKEVLQGVQFPIILKPNFPENQ